MVLIFSRSLCLPFSFLLSLSLPVSQLYFLSKLSDSEAEAAETQVWLDFALEFGYINQEQFEKLDSKCNNVIGKLVNMANQPEK